MKSWFRLLLSPVARRRIAWLTIGFLSPVFTSPAAEPPPPNDGNSVNGPAARAEVKLGLSMNEPGAFQGYTLVAPMMSTTTYLIDMEGRVVHTWQSDHPPAIQG